jgi:hypothetical protein
LDSAGIERINRKPAHPDPGKHTAKEKGKKNKGAGSQTPLPVRGTRNKEIKAK